MSEIKFLGVVIDQKLKWKQHIEYIKGKISKSLAILYKSKDILNYKALYIIYCTLIVSYMSYCVELWGLTFKMTINSIVILQKWAIGIINKAGYCDHTNPLFIKSHAMKFNDLVYYKIMQITYRAKEMLLPDCVQKFFSGVQIWFERCLKVHCTKSKKRNQKEMYFYCWGQIMEQC